MDVVVDGLQADAVVGKWRETRSGCARRGFRYVLCFSFRIDHQLMVDLISKDSSLRHLLVL